MSNNSTNWICHSLTFHINGQIVHVNSTIVGQMDNLSKFIAESALMLPLIVVDTDREREKEKDPFNLFRFFHARIHIETTIRDIQAICQLYYLLQKGQDNIN